VNGRDLQQNESQQERDDRDDELEAHGLAVAQRVSKALLEQRAEVRLRRDNTGSALSESGAANPHARRRTDAAIRRDTCSTSARTEKKASWRMALSRR
jgi:hypothetical protein